MQDIATKMHDTELRAAAIFALGCLIDTGRSKTPTEESSEAAAERAAVERSILDIVHGAASDGAIIVRIECAIAFARAAVAPTVPSSKKQHHEHLGAAFETQRDRVMQDFSAHRNMLVYQPGVIYESPASSVAGASSKQRSAQLRGPASEGGPHPARCAPGESEPGNGRGRRHRSVRSIEAGASPPTSGPVSRAASGALRRHTPASMLLRVVALQHCKARATFCATLACQGGE